MKIMMQEEIKMSEYTEQYRSYAVIESKDNVPEIVEPGTRYKAYNGVYTVNKRMTREEFLERIELEETLAKTLEELVENDILPGVILFEKNE